MSDKHPSTIYFFADPVNVRFPGFSKILEKILIILPNGEVITSLEGRHPGEIIIPLGIVASDALLKQGYNPGISFLIDAMTLGFSSVCRFYLRRYDFFNKELLKDLLRYFKYYPIERRIVKKYSKVIVVSEHDAEYLRNKFKVNNIVTISNGVDIPISQPLTARKFDFTLGILGFWGAGAEHDTYWFILEYLPRLKKRFPQLQLVTAGREASPETRIFLERHGVRHIGEVESLDKFFNEIDIFITTVRKECGILNKVLDAFAHKKVVLGLEHNLYAFRNLKNGYYSYKNFDDLVRAIAFISENQDMVRDTEENAYAYILENHNWERNYAELITLVEYYYPH